MAKAKPRKQHRALRTVAIILSVLLVLEAAYCFLVFTDIPAIKNLREAYIETALATMSHHWMATYFLPNYQIRNVAQRMEIARINQGDKVSDRDPTAPPATDSNGEPIPTEPVFPTVDPSLPEADRFYALFWELDRSSFAAYVQQHPEALSDGWDNIYINEAGLDDDGTGIYTTMGEQVLAIDAKNGILLLRVTGTGYRGVLAVAKDPSQLRCVAAGSIGSYGQKLGNIVRHGNGILGITGSGFIDEGGMGNGGTIAGYTMCEGVSYGTHYTAYGYKRIELTRDNHMYIANANAPVADDVTDAVEFWPAIIVDGKLATSSFDGWNGIQPRACIGQSANGEILMLVVEGRQVQSVGITIENCAYILQRHNAYNAMNLDGGTSAVMWFNGKYVTQCSNGDSRYLPNAWVYGYNE